MGIQLFISFNIQHHKTCLADVIIIMLMIALLLLHYCFLVQVRRWRRSWMQEEILKRRKVAPLLCCFDSSRCKKSAHRILPLWPAKNRSVVLTTTDDWGFDCAASFLSDEKVKDYKYYLRMWAKEREPKKETIKDLPRMNQVTSVTQYVCVQSLLIAVQNHQTTEQKGSVMRTQFSAIFFFF